MSSQLTDTDLDSLINDGGLDLAEPLDGTLDAESATLAPHKDLSFFGKIPVHVTLEVASTEVPLKELMEIDTSSVIVLDKLAGEPLDVKVNGALFAKAEVVVMNGNYGLRIVELCSNGLDDLTA
ncbi:flagellar motor switch protein FliN [Zestomonas thermotolerans]|uniref:flagellar motor switch protein FliN n=1 Tax=Zestomonas thermotolerans TaxID=157784 RepID=UPI00037229BF|nr:flagellar motor switch protein FliN [Pseudomonas thermotolerans]MBO2512148.1 flagellar motor switch protein FliN [Gammaproteobacteria bacterium]